MPLYLNNVHFCILLTFSERFASTVRLLEELKAHMVEIFLMPQFVESTFLWKLHDLYNQEASISDGIHLVPDGLENIICVKPRQYAMHCDAMSQEFKLVGKEICS